MGTGKVDQVKIWFQRIWPRFSKFWFTDWFNPHSSFLSLPAFWGPFIVLSAATVVLYMKVVVDQNLEFDITGDVDDWYKWFQVPIWTLALLIPVIGLFNANHKSEQAKEGMRLTGDQNRFANYYKHAEEFSKHCKTFEEHYKEHKFYVYSRKLHASLYPDGKVIGLSPNLSVIIELEKKFNRLNEEIKIVIDRVQNSEVEPTGYLEGLNSSFYMLSHELRWFFTCESVADPLKLTESQLIVSISESALKHLTQIYFYFYVLEKIFEFDAELKNDIRIKFRRLHVLLGELKVDNKFKSVVKVKFPKTGIDLTLQNTTKPESL